MQKKKDYVGLESYNNFGSKIIITRSNGSTDVDIYFPQYDWIAKNKDVSQFKNGNIKCPYEKRYSGVGYIGEGDYKLFENKKESKAYSTWRGLLKRCYTKAQLDRHNTYKNVFVCEEWHNFQNFAEWYYNNYYEVDGQKMHLDKDILYKGNKIYSPQTCVFVPQNINKIFTKSDGIRGDYPIGVYYCKTTNKFKSQCYNGYGGYVKLGSYNTPQEAFQSYKCFKENIIKRIADEYKAYIPKELYDAMYRYEVEITD